MVRTIVAAASETLLNSISDTLKTHGIQVRFQARTGAEVLRAVRRMGGGIVICTPKLLDMTCRELYENLNNEALMLILGKPAELSLLRPQNDVFQITLPVKSGELVGSVRVLLQIDDLRIPLSQPKRSDQEKEIISKAKETLMIKNGMSEDQAHRFIQKQSMETSTPMVEIASMILNALM